LKQKIKISKKPKKIIELGKKPKRKNLILNLNKKIIINLIDLSL
jgi:hypothetical protein